MNKNCKNCEFGVPDIVDLPQEAINSVWCDKNNVFVYPQSLGHANVCKHFSLIKK